VFAGRAIAAVVQIGTIDALTALSARTEAATSPVSSSIAPQSSA
jgi:hypothetical protein